ncbi:MAG: PilZ domain-containing protein [Candidatus Aminicenantes bacterium]|nr:PilZ domain-containing protein [Candidatus Aminicenantes bacterium]
MKEPGGMKARAEKRQSARSAYELPVQFELSSVASPGLIPLRRKGVGVDISEHGIGLFTDYPLKKNEVLKVFFPLSSHRATLPVFARVAWAASVEKRFRVGMQFLH